MIGVDLEPAARRAAEVVAGVGDDQLSAPTPCPKYTVGDLLEHIGGFAIAFTGAARKSGGELVSAAPDGDAARLPDDWRTSIPAALAGLAQAWRDSAAWTGMTRVGGVDLPGDAAGIFALDEVLVHGWDLAVATGQPYDADDSSLYPLQGMLTALAGPDQRAARDRIFGPVIDVQADAPLLDRVIGLTGRDPAWTADRAGERVAR